MPRSTQPLTFTTATFAATKFGSTKMKSSGRGSNGSGSSSSKVARQTSTNNLGLIVNTPAEGRKSHLTSMHSLVVASPGAARFLGGLLGLGPLQYNNAFDMFVLTEASTTSPLWMASTSSEQHVYSNQQFQPVMAN
ncbi:protein Tob1-like protein [Lates japonicus]|uniref:Protein Tob1-like protein n=1 Tax=Lates japonicus TaxID=270547 RepID=A0AAD3R561_LATJO|nr:protein Tob1-like protein [Lates japonicus]